MYADNHDGRLVWNYGTIRLDKFPGTDFRERNWVAGWMDYGRRDENFRRDFIMETTISRTPDISDPISVVQKYLKIPPTGRLQPSGAKKYRGYAVAQ